jgi:hypothetical protein
LYPPFAEEVKDCEPVTGFQLSHQGKCFHSGLGENSCNSSLTPEMVKSLVQVVRDSHGWNSAFWSQSHASAVRIFWL